MSMQMYRALLLDRPGNGRDAGCIWAPKDPLKPVGFLGRVVDGRVL